jgi:hypothetical protein
VVLDDPDDDAVGPPDVTQVQAGSDGEEASIQLDFAAPPTQLGGYFFIDADQDVTTGIPPEALFGLPTQELGVDYVVDLFSALEGVANVYDTLTFELVASLSTVVDGASVRFDLPLTALQNVAESINIGAIVGDDFQPTDWVPDVGAGTIEPFRDAPWMSSDPSTGTLAPGESADVTVTFGGADPGEYAGDLVVVSDDPRRPQVPVASTLLVTLPDGFGSVSGTISNARAGFPIPAFIEVAAERDGAPYPIDASADDSGTYGFFGPAGTWPLTVSWEGYVTHTGEVTIPLGDPGTLDVALEPLWPLATLEGGPIEAEVAAGASTSSTLVLGNVDGAAPLTYSVRELAAVSEPLTPAIALPPASTSRTGSSTDAATTAPPSVKAVVNASRTLILQDVSPWGSDSMEQVLSIGGVSFDIARSDDLATLDLSGYEVVFVANDQPTAFYGVLADQIDKLAAYAQAGGYLWFGVAAWGSNSGEADGLPLPGGGSVTGPVYESTNTVTAPDHPIAATLPNPFSGDAASHATVSGFPDGTVIATTPSGDPTLVEYELGTGRVLTVAQPVEFAWAEGQDGAAILAAGVPYAVDFEPFSDVPWIEVEPNEGVVAEGATQDLTVTLTAGDLEPGSYSATIVVLTDDPLTTRLTAAVTMTVTEPEPTGATPLRPATARLERVDVPVGLTRQTRTANAVGPPPGWR